MAVLLGFSSIALDSNEKRLANANFEVSNSIVCPSPKEKQQSCQGGLVQGEVEKCPKGKCRGEMCYIHPMHARRVRTDSLDNCKTCRYQFMPIGELPKLCVKIRPDS